MLIWGLTVWPHGQFFSMTGFLFFFGLLDWPNSPTQKILVFFNFFLQIPVFGQTEEPVLGCLYDAREERIVSGVSLWDRSTLNAFKTTDNVSFHKYLIPRTNNFCLETCYSPMIYYL